MNIWKFVPEERKHKLSKRTLLLTDGGVYDNIGYLALWNKCDVVLVSDGGGVTTPDDGSTLAGPDYGFSPFWRLRRYQTVQEYSGRGWQKAFLLTNLMSGNQKGAYWSTHTKTEHFGKSESYGYRHKEIVDKYIVKIRTDLNTFTDDEQKVLVNHGYLLAAAAVEKHIPELAVPDIPVTVPYKEHMGEGKVAKALARSHKRRVFGVQF